MRADRILEIVLYAVDLDAARRFYADVLGLEPFLTVDGRHLFYRCGGQVLLMFNPEATREAPRDPALPVPPHGAAGEGHICFAAIAGEIEDWVRHLAKMDVDIEADFCWPQGGRSIYFRDPAGNCLEVSEPRIWGLE
ncbi:MAG TPA: VOC family protein [Hyphomicrobiaceae bacterium]|nr:VOC family protein [Hyphomicrobiaceae bacterium]